MSKENFVLLKGRFYDSPVSMQHIRKGIITAQLSSYQGYRTGCLVARAK